MAQPTRAWLCIVGMDLLWDDLRHLEMVERRARETSLGGRVSLTTVEALLPLVAAPLARLAAEHRLEVELHLGDDVPSVRDREVDVALGIMRNPPSGCWGRKVVRLPYAVYATPEAISRWPRRWLLRATSLRASPEAQWEQKHGGPDRSPCEATQWLSGRALPTAPSSFRARPG